MKKINEFGGAVLRRDHDVTRLVIRLREGVRERGGDTDTEAKLGCGSSPSAVHTRSPHAPPGSHAHTHAWDAEAYIPCPGSRKTRSN